MAHTDSPPAKFASDISTGARVLAIDEQPSPRTFAGITALLFAAGAGVTALWCRSMSAMGQMAMPGGWTMSMAWMRMPGQTWIGAAASFVGMWVVMMVAMMLPALAPVLWRCRVAMGRGRTGNPGGLTAAVGAGYFLVWTGWGAILFPLGVALAALEMRSITLARDVPMAAGVVILMAGALQLTGWKAHHLACCRNAPGEVLGVPQDLRTAWQLGLRLGMHCGLTCANFTAVLLVLGVMNLRSMAVVTAAITAERLAPRDKPVAHAMGIVIVAGGLVLIARAAGLV